MNATNLVQSVTASELAQVDGGLNALMLPAAVVAAVVKLADEMLRQAIFDLATSGGEL